MERMEYGSGLEQLPELLLPWYQENCRDLPWRKDRDPYHIWVSEIMLQQTRVEAVKGYYERFLNVFPDIASLAEADDELLNKLWEGLGYYSRVRNLKKAAIAVMQQHGGVFPRSYDLVRKLPGIGPYTAGAVCSIAFDQPTPAVDGNVLRVFARLTDDDTPIDLPAFKEFVTTALGAVYPPQAGAFTQAVMELGATVCGPNRKPDCINCPCNGICKGFQKGTADTLPVKLPKRQRREEDITVFILSCDGDYALEKRPNKGLLAGLWQFPGVPGRLELQMALEEIRRMGLQPKNIEKQLERKHIFTHIQWNMRGFYVEVSAKGGSFTWLSSRQIEEESALPTAFRQFWLEAAHP